MSETPGVDTSGRLLAELREGDNAPPFSVSELSGALKRTVEGRFGHVRVRGEVSGFKRAASGHCYLTLKDDKAVLDAVLWKGQAARLPFAPEDGIEVIATGKLTTYPGRSKYQIVVETLELAGEGALMQLFERLKAKLADEGLFADERKRALPYLPRRIGVVTSPTGAVIRDILHRLSDRFPSHVTVWPVQVQGDGAKEQVAGAIAGFNAMDEASRPDLLIVARGGGSIEDLWAFNEEIVVRAIAASHIPLICAVGHETDTTLADYAADRRAPTPTAAAEIAVPVRADLLAHVAQRRARMLKASQRTLSVAAERLEAQRRLLPRPETLTDMAQQRIDEQADRLRQGLSSRAQRAETALAQKAGALRPALLGRKLSLARERLDTTWRMARQLHPERPLERGFARVTNRDGTTLTSSKAAAKARALRLRFADGTIDALAGDAQAGASAAPSSPRRVGAPARPKAGHAKADKQGKLF